MTTTLPLYQIDAFTRERFSGNPAAVVPLEDDWLPDTVMQQIAIENNLSETAFIIPTDDDDDEADFHLRWFTPGKEVDLCGHATLATGFVLREHLGIDDDRITFRTKSGIVAVFTKGDRLALDFPAIGREPVDITDAVVKALGTRPRELYMSTAPGERDMMAVFEQAGHVRDLAPDCSALKSLGQGCMTVTARSDGHTDDRARGEDEGNSRGENARDEDADGDGIDFISRFFAPGAGIDEDPVTGSAHCMLTPYWAETLGKTELRARQVSRRGGELWVEYLADTNRVEVAGYAVTYLEGEIVV